MTDPLEAITHGTIDYLQAQGLYISYHDSRSPRIRNVSLGTADTVHWATIHFRATDATIDYRTKGHFDIVCGTYQYANPDYLETITQHIYDWLHTIGHEHHPPRHRPRNPQPPQSPRPPPKQQ